MKTSNKLLIGLIAFIFLLATVFIGIIKYHQLPEGARMENTSSKSFNDLDSKTAYLLYFPRTLLLPLSW